MTQVKATDATTRITQDFYELARHLRASSEPDGVWAQLAEVAAQAIDSCDGVSVVKAPRAHRPAVVLAGSTEAALALGRAECLAGEGPSIEAAATDAVVTTNDLASDPRWTTLRELAGSNFPVRSVASFRIADDPCGVALSFHHTHENAFDATALAVARLVAAHAGTFALHQDSARKVVNLQQALETSRTIGAAIGIVMLARKLTPDQAFDVLRETSQRMHVKIRDLALLVTETGELPQVAAAPHRDPAARPAPVSVG